MKKTCLYLFTFILLALTFSVAEAFPQKSISCSLCHLKENVGKEGFPKKLTLADSSSIVKHSQVNQLTSLKADSAPKMDGLDTDQQWQKAPALTVKTTWLSPKPPKNAPAAQREVTLKSLYTKEKIYILASWFDSNPDLQKDLWEFKGGNWTRDKGRYDEDRLAFQWDNGVKGFAQVGCAITCHSYTKDYGKYTNNPGEQIDLWHWKSTRTKPLNWTDDGSVNYVSETEIGKTKGRKTDEGKSGEAKNEQELMQGDKKIKIPKYMFNPALTIEDKTLLKSSQAVLYNEESYKDGDKVPAYVITDVYNLGIGVGPKGSRGDVQTYAHWENGKWTLEISRALNTNNQDDTVFIPGQMKAFGLAVFDNNTDYNHSVSNVLYLNMVLPSASPTPEIQKKLASVIAKGLNLRKAPSVQGKKLGVLSKGTKITVLKQKGNWLMVKTKIGTGYVFAKYVRL